MSPQSITAMNRFAVIDSENSLDVAVAISDSRGMDMPDRETLLYRIDPTRNMARFYALAVEPALFSDVSLVRRWGRIGTAGRSKIELFGSSAEANAAFSKFLRRELGRGYFHKGPTVPAQGIVTPPGAKTARAGFVEPGTPAE